MVAGIFLLVNSAGYFVRGSAALAKRLGVPAMLIGLTIVAFGTSAPELVVNLLSVARGQTGLAVGNIIGSNIVNILIVLGGAAALKEVVMHRVTVWRGIPFVFLAALVLFALSADRLIAGASVDSLSRLDGVIMMTFFLLFLYYVAVTVRNKSSVVMIESQKNWQTLLMVMGGVIGLAIGGHLIVESAVALASAFNISSTFIGLTIIAVGTSLPELATTIAAVRSGEDDIAVGNVIGSNLFNTFFILGVSAIVQPLAISAANQFDAAINVLVTALFFAAMFVGRKMILERYQGAVFVVFYLAYLGYLVRLYFFA